MVGVINHWDILAHPVVTIRCFGWGVFFRAVAPWQSGPFLSLLRNTGHFGTAASKVPTILERCIALEMRAERIYAALTRAFSSVGSLGPFFAGLVEQNSTTSIYWNSAGLPPSVAAGRPTLQSVGRLSASA